MDSSNAIYCYLHIERGLVRGEHGNMEYREGRQQGICVDQSMTYNDFVSRVWENEHQCGWTNIFILSHLTYMHFNN